MMLASLMTFATAMALTVAPTAPQWESDYGKALTQTRNDSRPLLIVLDKPGQAVDAALLAEKKADAPLMQYDLCHVDVSTEYGKAVAKAFRADEFPYIAIIDKSGSVVLHRHAGQVSAEGWQKALARHQAGEREVRVTAAKPIVTEPTTPVTIQAEPVTYGGSYLESATPSYYATPVRSNCPNCQRNRR